MEYQGLEKDFGYEVTQRFLHAVDTIMGNRTAGKITQKEVGDITGMNSTNISRMRNEPERGVSLEACCRLCHHYKVSTYWLLLGEGQMWTNDELFSAYRVLEDRLNSVEKAMNDIEKAFVVIKKNTTRK